MRLINFSSSIPMVCIRIVFIYFISTSLFSCIATKKIVYVDSEDQEESIQSYKPQEWVYVIKPGDRFYIKVTDPLANTSFGLSDQVSGTSGENQGNIIFQSPNLHDYLVKEDGFIDIPLIGEIKAEGKTISELTSYLKEQSKGYISNPSVKLFMTNYNVTVLGEVNNPSFVQVITQSPTFFDAIGLANDLTDFADRKRVKIIRNEGGEVKIAYVDITDPNFISSPYYYLHPNDVIHIMPLRVKKFSNDNALPLFLSIITTIITVVSITSR